MLLSSTIISQMLTLHRFRNIHESDFDPLVKSPICRYGGGRIKRIECRPSIPITMEGEEVDCFIVYGNRRPPPAPRPRWVSAGAQQSRAAMSRGWRGLRASTQHQERSGVVRWKEGFSVVAPAKRMLLSSIAGWKTSDWALLKRWTSSKNSTVLVDEEPPRICILFRTSSTTSLMSLTVEMTAERATNLKDNKDDGQRDLTMEVFPWVNVTSYPNLFPDRQVYPNLLKP